MPDRSAQLKNLNKVLWPSVGFTKGDLVDYLRAVSPVLLPHVRGRPLTLLRMPDGIGTPAWYQENCRGAPPWLRTHETVARKGDTLRRCVVDDADGLLWVASIGTLELHPFPWRVAAPERPAARWGGSAAPPVAGCRG